MVRYIDGKQEKSAIFCCAGADRLLKLDKIDVEIIRILQNDGRMMYKDIANRLNVSLPTVRIRIKKLATLGVIKKFTIIIDPDKIFGKIRTVFMIQVSGATLKEAMGKLAELEQIRQIYSVAGGYNLVVIGDFDNVGAVGEFASKILPSIQGIQGISCSVITEVAKEEYGSSVEPEAIIQCKCEFCGGIVLGRPLVEEINGVKRFFTGKECAEAYKKRLNEKRKLVVETR